MFLSETWFLGTSEGLVTVTRSARICCMPLEFKNQRIYLRGCLTINVLYGVFSKKNISYFFSIFNINKLKLFKKILIQYFLNKKIFLKNI
jgi:hypothetical protein